jgi:hypothetical protein
MKPERRNISNFPAAWDNVEWEFQDGELVLKGMLTDEMMKSTFVFQPTNQVIHKPYVTYKYKGYLNKRRIRPVKKK